MSASEIPGVPRRSPRPARPATGWASGRVAKAAGRDPDLVADDLVDQAVLVGDAPRPVPVQAMLERLGLADSLMGRVLTGASRDVLEQLVDPLEDPAVLDLPVQVVRPGVLIPHVPHSASSRSTP